jgi:hypothetical protein
MSKNTPPKPKSEGNPQARIAIISASATVVTAVITGIFGLIQSNAVKPKPPTATPTIPFTATATQRPSPTPLPATATPLVRLPVVEIEGPPTAPLGESSYYTILSQHAQRAEWSIGGFADNQIFMVEPLAASHQIRIEPTDATRVGDTFTIVVTVYGEQGASATARHRFQVVASGD